MAAVDDLKTQVAALQALTPQVGAFVQSLKDEVQALQQSVQTLQVQLGTEDPDVAAAVQAIVTELGKIGQIINLAPAI